MYSSLKTAGAVFMFPELSTELNLSIYFPSLTSVSSSESEKTDPSLRKVYVYSSLSTELTSSGTISLLP